MFQLELVQYLKAVEECSWYVKTPFVRSSLEGLIHLPILSEVAVPFAVVWIRELYMGMESKNGMNWEGNKNILRCGDREDASTTYQARERCTYLIGLGGNVLLGRIKLCLPGRIEPEKDAFYRAELSQGKIRFIESSILPGRIEPGKDAFYRAELSGKMHLTGKNEGMHWM